MPPIGEDEVGRPGSSSSGGHPRRRQSKRGEVKCQHCNKVFNNPSNLQRHIRNVHGDMYEGQLVAYSCHICHR